MYPFQQSFSQVIVEQKYLDKKNGEKIINDRRFVVSKHIAKCEIKRFGKFKSSKEKYKAELVKDYNELFQHFGPGGRIFYNFGRKLNRTCLINCTSLKEIPDSTIGIMDSFKELAILLQAGAGVGMQGNAIRPRGSLVKGVGGKASGPVSFMHIANAICTTMESAGCLSGDSLIYTNKGIIPIKEIVESSEDFKVLTPFGYRKVVEKFNNGIKDAVKVTLENGSSLISTDIHKYFYINEKGKYSKKEIRKFNENDYVYVNCQELDQDYIYDKISKEEAYLLGYYFGNGYNIKSCNKNKIDISFKGLEVTIPESEFGEKVASKLKKIFIEKIGIEPKRRKGCGKCFKLKVYRTKLISYLEKLDLLKEKANNISIPDIIFNGSKEVKIGFISGYLDSDGEASGIKKGYKFTSISMKMLSELQILLNSLGIQSKFSFEERKEENWKTLYNLTITGRTWQKKFNILKEDVSIKNFDKISSKDMNYGFDINIKNNKKLDITKHSSFSNGKAKKYSYIAVNKVSSAPEFKNLVGMRIKSIEYLQEPINVYDIEVEDVHGYFANGIFVSNSRRGAMIWVLSIRHPDIFEFITCKDMKGKLDQFNISVGIEPGFMNAVNKDEDWILCWPVNSIKENKKPVYKRIVKAKDLWNKILSHAYKHSDPGLVFLDNANKYNPINFCETIVTCNP